MPPYRNPLEKRSRKTLAVQKTADENCYMSSKDFNEKYFNTNPRHLQTDTKPDKLVHKRFGKRVI
jgi:hypothetical protein